jgi:CRP-like cAMP-binding protein
VCSTSISGRQVTLTYIEPGLWFGDVSLFDSDHRSHDTYAHGPTSVLCVSRADFKRLLAEHTELYEALLWIASRRSRQLFTLLEDLNTLPLRARLSKQLSNLARSYGVPTSDTSPHVRIGLQLAQEELAQLVGASRQRVNQELKALERQEIIKIEPAGLIVRDRQALVTISETVE